MDNVHSKINIAPTYNFKQLLSIPQAFTIIMFITILSHTILNTLTVPFQMMLGIFSLDMLICSLLICFLSIKMFTPIFSVLPTGANYNLILLENKMFCYDLKKNTVSHIYRSFTMLKLLTYVILYDGEKCLILRNCGNVTKFLKDVAHIDI